MPGKLPLIVSCIGLSQGFSRRWSGLSRGLYRIPVPKKQDIQVVFPPAEGRRYVGVRGWPGAPTRSRRAGRNPLAKGSEQGLNQPTPRRVVVPPSAVIPHRDR
jgi:hypothetical protein